MRPSVRPVSRRRIARGAVLAVVLALLAPSAVAAVTHELTELRPQAGSLRETADGLTVVSAQGFDVRGLGGGKKPARLVAFAPDGTVAWTYYGRDVDTQWFYDVDPLPNGNLLVTANNVEGTVVTSPDPDTRTPVWIERLPFHDTHDVDQLDAETLLVAQMRAYDEETGRSDDRILVFDRTADAVEWEWRFRDHYPRDGGGSYADDWTDVNDVDRVRDGEYLVSVRNFDQVILVNRSTGRIGRRLGADDRQSVLSEQHNPRYLESEAGRPTILVADSENDRVVEYERRGDGWRRTWELGGPGSFSWPRDADRLPSGNTLVVDSLDHRVVEVAPRGEIVWEVYAPWGTYDAERVRLGDEAGRAGDLPTISDLNASGSDPVSGGAVAADRLTVAGVFDGTPMQLVARGFARRWSHLTPWITPVWMTGWDSLAAVAAGLPADVWAGAELFLARGRIVDAYRRGLP